MRLVLSLLAALAVPLAARAECVTPAVTRDAPLAAAVDAIVDRAAADGFAGGVAIVRDGALVYARTAGLSSETVPVGPRTLFHVASITKYLTAALVLRAAEEKRLALDDSVGVYFPGTNLAARGTTIADLLAHRSGLGSSYAAEAHADAAAAVAAIDAAPVDETKIGAFRYSNDGYDLLAVILEKTHGEPYEEIARRFLARGCILDAAFWGEVDLSDPERVGQPLRQPPAELRARNYGMIGSAGLLVTAEALAGLQAALAAGELLGGDSLAELFAPRGKVSIGEAAYGAFLMQHDALGSYLSARGYEDWGDNAVLNHYRDRNLILAVVTSKGPPEGTPPFRDTLSKAIEQALVNPP